MTLALSWGIQAAHAVPCLSTPSYLRLLTQQPFQDFSAPLRAGDILLGILYIESIADITQ
jgi:hypothetical protein